MQIDAKLLVTIFGVIIAGIVGFYSARLQTGQEILELERKIDARALATSVLALRDELGNKIDEARVARLISDAKLSGLNQGQINTLIEKQLRSVPDAGRVNSLIDVKLQAHQAGMERDEIIALVVSEVGKLPAEQGGLNRADVTAMISEQMTPLEPFVNAKGAVLAFDRSFARTVVQGNVPGAENGACPPGWSFFEPAGGRMIVGAGPHDNQSENGKALTEYNSFVDDKKDAVGGAETHSLSSNEVGSHQHNIGAFDTPFIAMDIARGADARVALFAGTRNPDGSASIPNFAIPHGGRTNLTDAAEPHNNMPPYIALYFCKKEAG